jgi:hypothetical protein
LVTDIFIVEAIFKQMHSLPTDSINAENSLLHGYVDESKKGHSAPFHSDIKLNVSCNPKISVKTISL